MLAQAEFSSICPLGGPQTHEVAFRNVVGDGDIADLGVGDQNVASLCHFYRRIGSCVVPEPTPEPEDLEQ